jgi:hypothetical protein
VVLYFATERTIFRGSWYRERLEPNSTTGQVEYHLYWLKHAAPEKVKVPEVLVVGDSRIAEGFAARTAASAVQGRLHFTNFGIPGSAPRVWYYVLRDADPDRNRFAAIAIALDHYSDDDGGDDQSNRRPDLNYLASRLKISDCSDFARSYSDRTMRRGVLTDCLFPGVSMRADVLAFLSDIPDRLARAQDWREHGAGYVDGYGGKPEELTGLTVDRASRSIHFPPGLQDWQTTTIQQTIFPDPTPQTGALTRYRLRWLGRILDLYKRSKTEIVFFQIPRAPWPGTESKGPKRFLDSVAGRPNLAVLPMDTFEGLERPETFADGLHLNRKGRPVFSTLLGEKIGEVVRIEAPGLTDHAGRKPGGRAEALPHIAASRNPARRPALVVQRAWSKRG